MKTERKYHISNFGYYKGDIPRDRDGYTYTTISGWIGSNQGADLDGMSRAEKREWAASQAAHAKEAIARANTAIAMWQTA